MSVNRDRPHLFILPEDRANSELATGFHLEIDPLRQRQMQILPIAGGWQKVLNIFKADHVAYMRRFPNRFMILVIDFDEREDRFETAQQFIPDDLKDRVFVLGSRKEPEDLRRAGIGSNEDIGLALAKDCREDNYRTWGHELLNHNAGELERLREKVRPIFF